MIKLLIFSRDLRSHGGVVNFVNLLQSNFSNNIAYTNFQIGERLNNKEGTLKKIYYSVCDALRLAVHLINKKYDLVHINPSLDPKALFRDGFFLIILYAFRFRKIVCFFHGWDMGTEERIKKNRVLSFLFKLVFGNAYVILVLGSSFRKSLIKFGFDSLKIIVVTTMFDGRIFNGQKHNYSRGGNTILFLSRFVKEKGVYELLKAFQEIAGQFSDAQLIMAGDGPELEQMVKWVDENRLSSRIIFTGYIRGSEKAGVLLKSNIFLFPTYHGEGCPVALLEAMGAGLVVITTAVGGIPDIFEDGKNGIIIDSITPDSIASAITRVFCNSKIYYKVQEYNQRQAWENYEAAVVTGKIESIYRKVAAYE